MIFLQVTVRLLRETEYARNLLPVQKPSGYLVKLCRVGEHQHSWHIDVHDDENFHTLKCEVKT